MDTLRKVSSKLGDKIAKQQQAVTRQFIASGYEHSDVMVIDELELQQRQQSEKLYRSSRSGKDFQRESVKAPEDSTAIGYKHTEAEHGAENATDETLAKAASIYGDARKHVEKEQEDFTKPVFSPVISSILIYFNNML